MYIFYVINFIKKLWKETEMESIVFHNSNHWGYFRPLSHAKEFVILYSTIEIPSTWQKACKNGWNCNHFRFLDWPAQSPDLNPIENLWIILKKQLRDEYESPPRNLDELWERIEEQWYAIPLGVCKNLVESMPRQTAAVLSAKGLWTKPFINIVIKLRFSIICWVVHNWVTIKIMSLLN